MDEAEIIAFVRARFAQVHGTDVQPDYPSWRHCRVGAPGRRAALGVREAEDASLFLEVYLDQPVEKVVSQAFGRTVPREDIVEIGCLASDSPAALLILWDEAARDFAGRPCVAVATLTGTVRRLLARVGVALVELAAATPDRLAAPGDWGRYYEDDPRVCAGIVSDGAEHIARYLAARTAAA